MLYSKATRPADDGSPGQQPGDRAPALSERAQILASAVSTTLLGIGRLGVAYSGGVDSATLLALAARTLGHGNVIGILGVSPGLPARERQLAHETARVIGVEVVEITTREGDNPAYVANGPDRPFHCKEALFSAIDEQCVGRLRLDAVAYGETADEAGDPDNPGAFAATNHRVLRPLADAGLSKPDVRELARWLGLPVADKPSEHGLASRIPQGVPVTPERLAQIERAENVVRALGFAPCQVRPHGEVARVQVPAGALARAVTEPARTALAEGIRAAGFSAVALDLDGIQPDARAPQQEPGEPGPALS